MNASKIRANLEGLERMKNALKTMVTGKLSVQVGVFASDSPRSGEDGTTNADIGFAHEMGSVTHGLPRRSFLWDTFADQGPKFVKQTQFLVRTVLLRGNVTEFFKQICLAAENLVQEAFDTGGFGKWVPLKHETLVGKLKGSLKKRRTKAAEQESGRAQHSQILVDTHQLRNAIAARIGRHS